MRIRRITAGGRGIGGIALAALLGLLSPIPGRAQGAINVTDLSGTYGTFGTTPQLCVPAASARATLFLYNSGSTSIGYSFGRSPALGAAGTITLPSGGTGWAFFGPGAAPMQPIYCVSSGSGAQLTILIGNE
jgi:hypothetical protein